MNSSEIPRCAECGGELPPGLPRGLCPRCALQVAAGLGNQVRNTSGSPELQVQPGDYIGRYKLLQLIGEGGMGHVWLAEQEEPIRRKVALKVIKLGMDTRSVIARFEAERQALALMEHPNIAKVLDAGATATGRPYFVMELVRGVRITDYCTQHNLTTTARLDLFTQVCHAIQHAHQKGIIHRDIKPSNILVTLHDGVPVPKVIDFGIAKATSDQRLTDKTLFTAFEQFIGTPAYMSPEQAEISGLDIDTRSDIYSLGVLLYQLLTDRTPFDAKELLQAGFDELRRTIRELEPARPSTRLSTLLVADLTAVAASRQTDAAKLVNLLRGDLDWIVMKALEKDRTRRYDTANAFAADIRCYLEGEPVSAAAPSAAYRFRKFARRHKTALGVAAAFVVLLIAATVASTWQAIRATRAEEATQKRVIEVAAERDAKEKARQESEAVTAFVTGVFQSSSPKRAGRTVTVAETLDRAARKLEVDLAGQPAQRARLQLTLGVTYHSLGLEAEAIPLLEKARDYYVASLGKEHPATVNAMYDLAMSLHTAGRREEALKMRQELLAIRRKVLGLEHPDTIAGISGLAASYHAVGRRDEALKLREEELALSRKVLGEENSATIGAMGNLAISYYHAGRRDEALKLREKVLMLRRKVSGPEDLETLNAMFNLANSFQAADRLKEALDLREQVLAGRRKLLDSEHPETIDAMAAVASSYHSTARFEEAVDVCAQVLALSRKVRGEEHPHTLDAMANLADAYHYVHRWEEALKLREEALALSRKILDPMHPDVLDSMAKLADSYHAQGRRGEALQLREDVLSLCRKALGQLHPKTLDALDDLAESYHAAGRRTEALKLREDVLPLRRQISGPEHNRTLASMSKLADSYRAVGRKDEAFQLWEQVLAINRKRNGPEHPATIQALSDLAWANNVEERYAQSTLLYRELLRLRSSRYAATNDRVASATSSLGFALCLWAWSERDAPDKTNAVQRAYEAEQLLRDCLSTRAKNLSPRNPFLAETRSRLGMAHMVIAVADSSLPAGEKQAQFTEAEALMVQGYEATREADKYDLTYSRQCLNRLLQLYRAWGKREKLDEWEKQLATLDATEAATKLSAGAARETK